MRWRGRRQSSNVKYRSGLPDRHEWAVYDPRGWWSRWRESGSYQTINKRAAQALDRYVKRKDRK